MTGRQLVGVLALGAGGWLAYRWLSATTLPAAGLQAPVALPWGSLDLFGDMFGDDTTSDDSAGLAPPVAVGSGVSSSYLQKLSLAEDPSQDPYAKNPGSTASGLYQFTKATWTGLGGQWGSDPSQAFGGLRPSVAEQTARAQQLTASNAGVLAKLGADINDLTLYAAHIFNPQVATKVLAAAPTTPLSALMAASTVAKNPALGSTVQSFFNYLAAKVG